MKDETAHALLEAVKAQMRLVGLAPQCRVTPLLVTAWEDFLAAHPSGEEAAAALRASSAPSDDEREALTEREAECVQEGDVVMIGGGRLIVVDDPGEVRCGKVYGVWRPFAAAGVQRPAFTGEQVEDAIPTCDIIENEIAKFRVRELARPRGVSIKGEPEPDEALASHLDVWLRIKIRANLVRRVSAPAPEETSRG